MTEQSIPGSDFWIDPEQVAQRLFEKLMIVGDKTVLIRRAQGYAKEEGMVARYRPMLEMEPGTAYCPQLGAHKLFVFAVRDGDERGGRVLIRDIEHEGQVISGSGNVTKYLGITQANLLGTTTWIDQTKFQVNWINDS